MEIICLGIAIIGVIIVGVANVLYIRDIIKISQALNRQSHVMQKLSDNYNR